MIEKTFETFDEQALKEKCWAFMDELGVPVTKFAKRIELSPQTLHDWKRSRIHLGDATLQRIYNYLSKYGF